MTREFSLYCRDGSVNEIGRGSAQHLEPLDAVTLGQPCPACGHALSRVHQGAILCSTQFSRLIVNHKEASFLVTNSALHRVLLIASFSASSHNIFPWVETLRQSRSRRAAAAGHCRADRPLARDSSSPPLLSRLCNADAHWSNKLTFLSTVQSAVLIEFFFLLFVLKICAKL